MYHLIKSLKSFEHNYSVYPFGEFVHYTDMREGFNPQELQHYLETKNNKNIKIEMTKTTIEDTFMELAK
jgi:hypothetical protein